MSSTEAVPATEPGARPSRAATALRLVVIAAGVALLVLAGRRLGAYVPQFATWVESLGFWAPLAYGAGYVVATVAFIPAFILTVAAGTIFGLAKGTAVVFVGATIGTMLAFLIARYVARGAIERRIEGNPKFRAIDRAVSREGLKIVFLLRLSPAFPYNLLNYALGLTSVRFRDYAIASIGMLPGTFLYVYAGKAIGDLAAITGGAEVSGGSGQTALFVFGLIATVVVTVIVTRIARRALSQEIEDA